MPSVDFEKKTPSMIKSIQESSEISKKNKELILQHHKRRKELSLARRYKYLYMMKTIARNTNFDFDKATIKNIEDFEDWVYDIDCAESTRKDYIVFMKAFLKWVNGGVPPKCTKNLKTPKIGKNQFDMDNILTEEDIQKLIDNCDSARDKAIVSVIYESGGRVSEAILDTNIEHMKDDPRGKKIFLHGEKTKGYDSGPRWLLLHFSTPWINSWLSSHPNPNDNKAPLFTNVGTRNNNARVQYQSIRILLRKIAKKAEIDKPVNPHAFRHARATFLASRVKEPTLRELMGWSPTSTQPAIYVHLSGRDIDREVLKVYGIEEEENPEVSILTPGDCPRCKNKVAPGSEFCPICRLPMNIDYEKQILVEEEERELKDRIEEMEKRIEKMQIGTLESILLSDFFAKDPNRKKQADLFLKDIENANISDKKKKKEQSN